jgi:hypothetical protein
MNVDVYLFAGGNSMVSAVAQGADTWPNFSAGFLWWDALSQPTTYNVGYKSKELNLRQQLQRRLSISNSHMRFDTTRFAARSNAYWTNGNRIDDDDYGRCSRNAHAAASASEWGNIHHQFQR